ncbi:HNH endonuclease [Bacillus phage yong1]|nr:HNH endonuclease [Bacillus phage yong1]
MSKVKGMPRKPLRVCPAPGCPSLTRDRYCDEHKTQQQEETKHYNKHSRNKTITSFYKSTDWKRTRQLGLIRDNYLCQHCLKDHCFTPADMVHHIVEVKEDWSKRLDLDNLVSLCNACHNKVHGGEGK